MRVLKLLRRQKNGLAGSVAQENGISVIKDSGL